MPDQFTVIGVVSHGVADCKSMRDPIMYTDVYKYIGWINEKAAKIGLFHFFRW